MTKKDATLMTIQELDSAVRQLWQELADKTPAEISREEYAALYAETAARCEKLAKLWWEGKEVS